MPPLDQSSAAGLTPLEYELLQRAGVIGAVYGVLVLIGIFAQIALWLYWRQRPPPIRAAVADLISRPWRIEDAGCMLAVLGLGFASSALISDAWLEWTAPLAIQSDSRLVVLQSLAFHILGLLALAAIMSHRRLSWKTAFGISAPDVLPAVGQGVVALLSALPILLALTFIFQLALNLLGYRPSLQDVAVLMAEEQNPWMRLYFVALAVGLAPLFEELLFRGILLPVLARRYGAWAATLISAFLFAAIHGHLPSFATLFALSVALSAAYALSGSIVTAVTMHALFNTLTTALLLALP
ncbi:MAG: CPBP family intramembrane metalloprotease [Kiritimatiellae bacterium]|nr:CPBP family intramembrane metalloprotease [Kiritimatiellia bacterium]MDW8457935.1 CPBP family intramembrane glutamic endopeptidase [Verrucomicrobiota bacterium]